MTGGSEKQVLRHDDMCVDGPLAVVANSLIELVQLDRPVVRRSVSVQGNTTEIEIDHSQINNQSQFNWRSDAFVEFEMG